MNSELFEIITQIKHTGSAVTITEHEQAYIRRAVGYYFGSAEKIKQIAEDAENDAALAEAALAITGRILAEDVPDEIELRDQTNISLRMSRWMIVDAFSMHVHIERTRGQDPSETATVVRRMIGRVFAEVALR